MTVTSKRGFMIALICGAVGLLAFFALPFTAIGGETGLWVATNVSGILWVEMLLAGLVIVMAGIQFSGSVSAGKKNTGSGCLLALGIVGTLICLMFFLLLTSLLRGLLVAALGIGFWLFFLAMIGTIIGAAMSFNQSARMAPGGPMPFTQYAPNQQPPMQQYAPGQQPSSPQYPPFQQPQQYPPNQGQPPSSPQYPPQQYPPNNG